MLFLLMTALAGVAPLLPGNAGLYQGAAVGALAAVGQAGANAVAASLLAPAVGSIVAKMYESRRVGVYAIYPCRQFVPAKLRVFVDFLADLYGPEPYWDRGIKLPGAAA